MPDLHLAAKRAAQKYGVDENVFLRLINQESGFNPSAKSPAGAQGISQFIPSTAKAYGVNLNDNRVTDDLEGAARYLRDNLKRTGGDYKAALSIYNSGRPDGYKRFGETANYVKSILGGTSTLASGGSSGPSGGSRRVTTTKTTPGVDRSGERRALILQFLQTRKQPGAIVSLATGLAGAKDTPGSSTSSTRTVSSAGPAGTPAHHSKLLELFYNGPGGINAKNSQPEPRGFVSGHTDHVHVAAGPKTVDELGKLAEGMGLHVGENPHFGGVHPVHVKNSFHYKGEAIDVSGTPQQMRAFNHRVAKLYRLA